MRRKLGQNEVLKPVAQTIVSSSYIFPSWVCKPLSEILTISSATTSVLSATKASRYPCPGVNLRFSSVQIQNNQTPEEKTDLEYYLLQPTPKFGIKSLQSLLSPFNRLCINKVNVSTACFCSSESFLNR